MEDKIKAEAHGMTRSLDEVLRCAFSRTESLPLTGEKPDVAARATTSGRFARLRNRKRTEHLNVSHDELKVDLEANLEECVNKRKILPKMRMREYIGSFGERLKATVSDVKRGWGNGGIPRITNL